MSYKIKEFSVDFDITFLHTSEVHIITFDALIEELDPNLAIKHIVKPEYLEMVITQGVSKELEQSIQQTLCTLSQNTRVVVCTCSTIGSIAESVKLEQGCVQRVDRAMADWAVQHGKTILIIAALTSTLTPTYNLLRSSALIHGLEVHIDQHCVDSAWPLFESGRYSEYLKRIAVEIKNKSEGYDVIVLAQASMVGVMDITDNITPIVSSPRLGVLSAIKAVNEHLNKG